MKISTYQDVADSPGEKPLHLIIEEFAEYQVLEMYFFSSKFNF